MKTLLLLLGLLLPLLASARVSTFVCEYARYDHPEHAHQAEEHFSFTFVLDEVHNMAYVLGNPGVYPITEHDGVRRFTFVETSGTGEAIRTTVASAAPSALRHAAATQHDVAPSPALIQTLAHTPGTQPSLRLEGRCSAVGGR